mgnify:CR=1 FL=1
MAISGRYCRSERAIVKRHAPPICHCEERSDVAISGRHCRSVRAIEKRHAPPICHCEEAGGRRGNLGKALPFGTSHRKNGTHLRFVIARRPEADVAISGRHPRSVLAAVKTVLAPRFVIARSEATWQSREGTPDPYWPPLKQCWPPDLSLRGAKRRGNLGKAPPIRTGRR